MNQEKDDSLWKRKYGSNMGIIEYTINVTLTAYLRGYQVGKHYLKLQRQFVIFGIITIVLLGVLT